MIEVAFPLRQASIDSVHEKNVRHGHISTLHIWPARRPLAACRAALIATLLPDPGNKRERDELLLRLGGKLKKTLKKKRLGNGRVEEVESWETEGGILHWGRESEPDLEWFRDRIRGANGGDAPEVLDPFAGGGAIPLEAMRLGCDVTAADINPVAWFILKCTLEYPQKLAGQRHRLPDFALRDPVFATAWLKAQGFKPVQIGKLLKRLGGAEEGGLGQSATLESGETQTLDLEKSGKPEPAPVPLEADLSWHVRAWGRWVLKEARAKLARFYPTYAEYCSLKPYKVFPLDSGEALKLVPLNDSGEPQVGLLNAGFDSAYLQDESKPRWIAKPTVAYFWARTVPCKSCRAELPLLKTRWLAKKDNKRVLLLMHPKEDGSGVNFDIESGVAAKGGNAAQRREHDKRLGAGTMSRAGATCPCCGTTMTMSDLRLEGRAGRFGMVMTAVAVNGPKGKEYRLPTQSERDAAMDATGELESVFAKIPFGMPIEPTSKGGSGASRAFSVDGYGIDQWHKLFTPRQLLALGCLAIAIQGLQEKLKSTEYSRQWREAITCYNAVLFDKTLDYGSAICTWHNSRELIGHTFARFALPMVWDMAELALTNDVGGSWLAQLEWVARYVSHGLAAATRGSAKAKKQSAIQIQEQKYDLVITDPPYYDAIPYSDLMDFFHVWLRRTLHGISREIEENFTEPLSPKWNHGQADGELIDDASRFEGEKARSKKNYESGMARAFAACHASLADDGRMVIVFAHKKPDAWETLVTAMIRAGFVVVASWPIQTEMGTRMRAFSSAALASSVWLVCRKRDSSAKAGWDTQVIAEMESNISQRLRDFWDAGIRGPDFVWAATGPALEAYSRYPVVKKASEAGGLMGVEEFLRHVRRIVVDFVVGRVLSREEGESSPGDSVLDDVTTYYLLHRSDFKLAEAPSGPCILYMVSCGLSERELADQFDLLSRTGKSSSTDAPEESGIDDAEAAAGGGNFKLKSWSRRRRSTLGQGNAQGRQAPLIDQLHKLMQLWKAGDVAKVDAYIGRCGLRRSPVFSQLLQALIEQSREEGQDEECSLLERIANHIRALGADAHGSFDFE